MSGKTISNPFPYPHLTVVPSTTSELLFAEFNGEHPQVNVQLISIEAFEQDAPEIVLATLGQAGLVASSVRIDTARSLAKDHPRLSTEIQQALKRRSAASTMIQLADRKLRTDYLELIQGELDENAETKRFKREEFESVQRRTERFKNELPFQIMKELERQKIEGIAARQVTSAQRLLALLYDSTLQLKPIDGEGDDQATDAERELA